MPSPFRAFLIRPQAPWGRTRPSPVSVGSQHPSPEGGGWTGQVRR